MGRPRIHSDRQQAWKARSGFEQSEKRRKYKADWIQRKRQQDTVDTTLSAGDEVLIELTLFGDRQSVRGRIIPGSTLSSTCTYPRIGDRIKHELIQIPFDVPETFTVQWHHENLSGVVSVPLSRIKPLNDN